MSKPEYDGRGARGGSEESHGAPVVAGGDAAHVFQSTEHGLNPFAAPITLFVDAHDFAA